jgi:hypothetical protein
VNDGQGGEPVFVLDENGYAFKVQKSITQCLVVKLTVTCFKTWIIPEIWYQDNGRMCLSLRTVQHCISSNFPPLFIQKTYKFSCQIELALKDREAACTKTVSICTYLI